MSKNKIINIIYKKLKIATGNSLTVQVLETKTVCDLSERFPIETARTSIAILSKQMRNKRKKKVDVFWEKSNVD